MYIYSIQAMPGYKAKFDGDTSAKYRVRRTETSASPRQKSSTAVIRTDMGYTEATALVERFNDKERESHSLRTRDNPRLWQHS